MEAHLPYKSVVVFIAFGTMLFAIVFVFAKRQITRFALKSNRVPHAAIGANVPKILQREIETRLKRVEEIKYEAQLLSENVSSSAEFEKYQFYYRMKAVDAVKPFEEELRSRFPEVRRSPGESLQKFLLGQQLHENGCLHGIKLEVIDRFVQLYEHARHEPAPFQQEQYQEYRDLMNHLLNHVRNKYKLEASSREHTEISHTELPARDKHHLTTSAVDRHPSESGSTCPLTTIPAQTDLESTTSDKGNVKDTCVIYRPSKMKESDSGMFLLTSRQSSSSEGSSAATETRFRQSGIRSDGQSYV